METLPTTASSSALTLLLLLYLHLLPPFHHLTSLPGNRVQRSYSGHQWKHDTTTIWPPSLLFLLWFVHFTPPLISVFVSFYFSCISINFLCFLIIFPIILRAFITAFSSGPVSDLAYLSFSTAFFITCSHVFKHWESFSLALPLLKREWCCPFILIGCFLFSWYIFEQISRGYTSNIKRCFKKRLNDLMIPHTQIFWGDTGVRSRGMTPEVTQETGRRRTTSEGQYQSGHDNTSAVHSPDFANNLALNPGGRPREVQHLILWLSHEHMILSLILSPLKIMINPRGWLLFSISWFKNLIL